MLPALRRPLFRGLGEEAFRAQLGKQHAHFNSLLRQLPDLARVANDAVFAETERLLKQLLFTLRNLRAAFVDILPKRLYLEVMTGLLDLPMQEMLDRVLRLRDIGIEDCNQLHHLMKTLLDARSSITSSEQIAAAGATDDAAASSTGNGSQMQGIVVGDYEQDGYVLIQADSLNNAPGSSGDDSGVGSSASVCLSLMPKITILAVSVVIATSHFSADVFVPPHDDSSHLPTIFNDWRRVRRTGLPLWQSS